MTQNNVMSIRVELMGKIAEEFKLLKKHSGLKLNTEVIRKIIHDSYLDIYPNSSEPTLQEVPFVE